jgi:hypothetical protein
MHPRGRAAGPVEARVQCQRRAAQKEADMQGNLSKTFFQLTLTGVFFGLFVTSVASTQATHSTSNAGIVRVSVETLAYVRIEVKASDKQIVIPYCDGADPDEYSLYCNQGLERSLEHWDGNKWNRATPGYPGEVFGIELDKWKPVVIDPGKNAVFYFKFSPSFYHIKKGEKLRLRVSFWSKVESMKTGKADGVFVSPAFECP